MNIYGIGIDLVNINRIKNSIHKNGKAFKNKIFSKKEIIYCEKKNNPYPFYAKRFAAKEAFAKALGTGIRNKIVFKNIQILNDKLGKPYIRLTGTTANYYNKKIKSKKNSIFLSLSDEHPLAQAIVIISFTNEK